MTDKDIVEILEAEATAYVEVQPDPIPGISAEFEDLFQTVHEPLQFAIDLLKKAGIESKFFKGNGNRDTILYAHRLSNDPKESWSIEINLTVSRSIDNPDGFGWSLGAQWNQVGKRGTSSLKSIFPTPLEGNLTQKDVMIGIAHIFKLALTPT